MKNRIKVLRAEHDMTQEELAEWSALPGIPSSPSRRTRYCPSLKLGYRIARTFAVGIDEVFTYEEEKDGPSADNEE